MWFKCFPTLAFLMLFLWKLAAETREMNDELPECKSVTKLALDGSNTQDLLCLYGLPYLESYAEVSALTVLNWWDENFNPEAIIKKLPRLRRLSIINGNLQRIVEPFPETARLLEIVEISGTNLRWMPENTFARLSALRALDLRNNALVYFEPHDLITVATLHDIYLGGNQWQCDENLSWLVNSSYTWLVERIADIEEMRCWAPFKGKPLLFVMEVMQRLQKECQQLAVCECELVYVVNSATLGNSAGQSQQLQQQQQQQPTPSRQQQQQEWQFMAFASVNCSHRGFTDMPAFLPANTTTLHLQGNKISDLTPLKTNPVYRSVIDLYLDDNEVKNVDLLDGTYWLEHFRLLSLSGNKMTDFATYALENVLLHSQTAVSLYLGNNPWRCDCQITPGFQEFLIKYPYLIKDISEVRCSAENKDYFNRQIRELTRTEICIPPIGPEIYPMDILNIFLGIMIIWILVKLVYDYYVFKHTGKLPWIVNLIP